MARIFRIVNAGLGDLTDDERVRYSFAYLSAFRSFESMYFHHLQGTGGDLWSTHVKHIAVLLSNPGVQFQLTPKLVPVLSGMPHGSSICA